MKFNKLRLIGFKSFVEPTDFLIEPGLTGVVGPNGCGKSNLVEALRWVMGENSYKNMRASSMDDVIFSGSGSRPARNMAEVCLTLDNSERRAPAAFNDSDLIEVSRRIEREDGSAYKVNARDVRARDVQLLFADASTGARSPSLVRQGLIGEIISAKPQARRRILEDAAGVAGLHARRHEAELRLKHAEDNLVRLEDVLKQVGAQVESLRRQARQAARYKNLAAEIRKTEALAAFIAWRECAGDLGEAERRLEKDLVDVAEATRLQAEAARAQAIAAHELPTLREKEAGASAALHRLAMAREDLTREEKRAGERSQELARRIEQILRDQEREQALLNDAADMIDRLEAEAQDLADAQESEAERREDVAERAAELQDRLAEAESHLQEAQAAVSQANAVRLAAQEVLREETQRYARFDAEVTRIHTEFALIANGGDGDEDLERFAERLEDALERLRLCEDEVLDAEQAHLEAREQEQSARAPLAEAESQAQRLETEIRTLAKILESGSGGLWPAIVEDISVEKGYEAALGAALGDDLEASVSPSAPAHWAASDASGDSALPPGVRPLSQCVEAPPVLHRRLNQIGLVLREEGARLRPLLRPGQRLVSRQGDLWRWDGFIQAAEAPTPAARRLAEKNRLGDLSRQADAARETADALRRDAEVLASAAQEAAMREQALRQNFRSLQRAVEETREQHIAAEKRRAQRALRLSALEEAKSHAGAAREESRQRMAEAERRLEELDDAATLAGALDAARARAACERAQMNEARNLLQSFEREAEARARRRAAIQSERATWIHRRENGADRSDEFRQRREEAEQEAELLAQAPDECLLQRRALLSQSQEAETARAQAVDARAVGEERLAQADRAARLALEAMSQLREERAAAQARVEGLRQRLSDIERAIASDLDCAPHQLAAAAEINPDDEPPSADVLAQKLETLKSDRERLGAVNLRADDELAEMDANCSKMAGERDDLMEAIRKLRGAIGNLNREGRERLLAAFDVVNGHFKELFATLFGGGAAELQLVESDDPLEAGLEILAKPPGKKPQTMTLLSGGEQALTAMSLIFAVFLTNPSPICVLDEVDAPLDDSNVERFCDLLDSMRGKTDTRFIVITHNPITMARMDRLFGVTQAERGVSQLVSVDLQQAEKFLEAV